MLTFLAFFFVLSLLVIVHEFGHYITAKLGGVGVERLSLGYPPRLFGVKIGETDYCISAIPFGGYVKLIGQEDFGREEGQDLGPKDFRGKSAPLRAAVLFAGSFMNIMMAVIIFFILYLIHGIPESSTVIGYTEPGKLANSLGLKPGDEIVKVQGKKVKRFEEVLLPLYTDDRVTLTVKRANGEQEVVVPRRLGQNEDFGIIPYYEARVGVILAGSPAKKAGFKPWDVITAIDDSTIHGWYHMSKVVKVNPGRTMSFSVMRDGSPLTLTVTIGQTLEKTQDGKKETVGRIGVTLHMPTRKTGAVESSRLAVTNTVFLATHMLDFLGKLLTGHASTKLLGGPVMIAQMAGESAKSGFSELMSFTAFISINLGVLNLIPFPVLDGGHILILFVESISRRKLSSRVRLAIQQTGTFLLFILMIYITFNDVMRFETIARFFGGG